MAGAFHQVLLQHLLRLGHRGHGRVAQVGEAVAHDLRLVLLLEELVLLAEDRPVGLGLGLGLGLG